jgi:hypothetical protein
MIPPKKQRKSFSVSNVETIKKFANKEEKRISKDIGGKQMPNSGSTPFMPADILLGDSVIDVKSCKGNQIVITVDMLSKIEKDARTHSKKPVLLLNFIKSKKELQNTEWILFPRKKG